MLVNLMKKIEEYQGKRANEHYIYIYYRAYLVRQKITMDDFDSIR